MALFLNTAVKNRDKNHSNLAAMEMGQERGVLYPHLYPRFVLASLSPYGSLL